MLAIVALAGMMTVADAEPCFTIEKEIVGESLNGVLKPGQTVEVLSPDCAHPGHRDFIVFKSDLSENLVIKQVWGLPGDRLVVDDKGSIWINDVQVLTPFDRPYILMGLERKKMKAQQGVLTGYLAFGHPGSVDSGRVGQIAPGSVIGIVRSAEGRARATSPAN